MLKLKLQYFGHPMHRAHSLEKTLMLGKFKGRRRRGRRKDEEGRGEGRRKGRKKLHSRKRQQSIMRPQSALLL